MAETAGTEPHLTPDLIARWNAHVKEAARLRKEGVSSAALEQKLEAFLRSEKELAPYVDQAARGQGTAAAPVVARHEAAAVSNFQLSLHPEVLEGDGTPVRCFDTLPFKNWGRTVANTPRVTFVPRTKAGICNLVQWAAKNGKTVRASGYRHTWSDLYSEDDQVLVSMLPPALVDKIPVLEEPRLDPTNEMQGIKIVGYVNENGVKKALCRIGAATTNEMFRLWCLGNGKADWLWTIPFNVIMVEITFGGSNAPICHGAGFHSTTLSDLVTSIEFVNARGQLQTVNDPQLLKVAAGCMGLLGIVTAVTLKLDPMTYARMQPVEPRVGLAVPPPLNYPIPPGVDMSGITPDQLAKARQDFEERCAKDYYAEWFWFAYQPNCWVNTWKNDGSKDAAVDYPGPWKSKLEEVMEYLGELVTKSWLFKRLSPYHQAFLLGSTAMAEFPTDTTIQTPLIDALHFQRGIQNMRVLDMEWEIPIPSEAGVESNFSICARAWWDAITLIYEFKATAPVRLTLEMRITGGSSMVLAPQNGNSFGTCSIEVITTENVDPVAWKNFTQQLTDAWSQYEDDNGLPLNIRPHWAKVWQGLTVNGTPIVQYLNGKAYAAQLPQLAQGLKAIAAAGGYGIGDLAARFSNPLLRQLFGAVLQ